MTEATSLTARPHEEDRQRTIDSIARELLDKNRIEAPDNAFNTYFATFKETKNKEFAAKALDLYQKMPGRGPIPPNLDVIIDTTTGKKFSDTHINWQDGNGAWHNTSINEYVQSQTDEAVLLERKRVFEKYAESIRNDDPPDFVTVVKNGASEAVSGITDGLMQGDFNILGHIFGGLKHIVTGLVMNIPIIGKPVRQAGTALAMVFTDYDKISSVFNSPTGSFTDHVQTFWTMAGQRAQSNDINQRLARDVADGGVPVPKDMVRRVNEGNMSDEEKAALTDIKNVTSFLGNEGGEVAKLYHHDPAKLGPAPLLTSSFPIVNQFVERDGNKGTLTVDLAKSMDGKNVTITGLSYQENSKPIEEAIFKANQAITFDSNAWEKADENSKATMIEKFVTDNNGRFAPTDTPLVPGEVVIPPATPKTPTPTPPPAK